jgi:ATP-dependent helicase HrpA
LENVSSFDELNRYLRGCDPAQLHVSENDLIGDLALEYDEAAFPDRVSLEGHEVPVSYSYAPGEDTDGVTLKLPSSLARDVSPAAVEWAVPGLRESQVSELLRALPKALRKQLMPFLPKVTEISRELRPSSKTLAEDLSRFVFRRYGIEVPPSSWSMEAVPMHLRPRVEIVTDPKKPALAGRDFNTLRNQLENAKIVAPDPLPAWRKAAAVWERFGLTSWNFGDLPEQVNVSEGPPTVEAWPGLQVEDGHVGIRLFHTLQAANRATVPGFQRLLELSLQKDLAWLHKDLRALSRLNPLYSGVYAPEELHNSAFANLRRHLLRVRIVSLREAVFRQALEQAVAQVPGLALTMVERLEPILKLRQEIARRIGPPLSPAPARKPLSSLQDLDLSKAVAQPAGARSLAQAELDSLLPRNFFETVSFDRFIHLPRYLKALLIRLERATLNPLKDQERARLVLPYAAAVNELRARKVEDLRTAAAIEDIRWAVEEYRVSVFAQEIGTAFPVSPKRLDEQLRQVRALVL